MKYAQLKEHIEALTGLPPHQDTNDGYRCAWCHARWPDHLASCAFKRAKEAIAKPAGKRHKN